MSVNAEVILTDVRQEVHNRRGQIQQLIGAGDREGIRTVIDLIVAEHTPDEDEQETLCDFLALDFISGNMPTDPRGYVTVFDVIQEQVRDLIREIARSEAATIELESIQNSAPFGANLTQDERAYLYENMNRYGGGFAKAMAEALVRADPENERRLLDAFPELFRAYRLSRESSERFFGSERTGDF